jgi:hypothetical protein
MISETIGFGVPNAVGPHHFVVQIPAGRNDPVVVIENYGLNGETINAKPVTRVIVSRDAWRVVADPLKAYLNRRLKDKINKRHPAIRFSAGDNKVERLLGHEVAVLAWAIEQADEDEARIAFTRWASHRPEEMHWLYQQIVADAGRPENEPTGWRLAIKQALIVKDDRPLPRRDVGGAKTSKTDSTGDQILLFASA